MEVLCTKITRRFHKACADYHLLEDGDHVLIGLSGGKDSLLLTELLGRRAKIYKPRFTVTALHVRVKERDYQTDLSYLESFCAEAGVPLLVRDTEIGEAPANAQSSNLQIFKSSNRKSPCFLCSWYRRKMLFTDLQRGIEHGCAHGNQPQNTVTPHEPHLSGCFRVHATDAPARENAYPYHTTSLSHR